jgi:hypothetical protein
MGIRKRRTNEMMRIGEVEMLSHSVISVEDSMQLKEMAELDM